MSEDMNNEGRQPVRLNRKMRLWNKYRNYIIGAAAVIVVIIIFAVILKSCGSKKNNSKNDNNTTQNVSMESTEKQATVSQNTNESQTQDTKQETTKSAHAATTVTISGSAEKQDYSSSDSFANSAFLGDTIISGISYYGYVDSSRVISDNNMTSDKATDKVSAVAALNPDKIYVMVGLNDLNYGTRSANDVAGYIETLVGQLKSAVPGARVYVISLLPITKNFESKSNIKIKQSEIDSLNKALSDKTAQAGFTFIDIAGAFKDGTGYFGSSYTGNGSNLNNSYYPYLLNEIAGASK